MGRRLNPGGAIGVMTGGILCGTFGWSSVFLVTVPVSVTAVAVAGRVLPEAARGPAAASTGTAPPPLPAPPWRSSTRARHCRPRLGLSTVLAALTASAALLTVFVTIERRTTDPLLPLELFGSRTLSTGVAVTILGGAAPVSTFVLITLYLSKH
jgi:hypothetical protein